MGKGSTPAPVAVQAEPLKGQGYAQLQSSSDVPLALRCTQKLWLAPKLSAKLFAMFSQVDGKAVRNTRARRDAHCCLTPGWRVSTAGGAALAAAGEAQGQGVKTHGY